MANSDNVIQFYLDLDDKLTPKLRNIQKGFVGATEAIAGIADKLVASVQKGVESATKALAKAVDARELTRSIRDALAAVEKTFAKRRLKIPIGFEIAGGAAAGSLLAGLVSGVALPKIAPLSLQIEAEMIQITGVQLRELRDRIAKWFREQAAPIPLRFSTKISNYTFEGGIRAFREKLEEALFPTSYPGVPLRFDIKRTTMFERMGGIEAVRKKIEDSLYRGWAVPLRLADDFSAKLQAAAEQFAHTMTVAMQGVTAGVPGAEGLHFGVTRRGPAISGGLKGAVTAHSAEIQALLREKGLGAKPAIAQLLERATGAKAEAIAERLAISALMPGAQAPTGLLATLTAMFGRAPRMQEGGFMPIGEREAFARVEGGAKTGGEVILPLKQAEAFFLPIMSRVMAMMGLGGVAGGLLARKGIYKFPAAGPSLTGAEAQTLRQRRMQMTGFEAEPLSGTLGTLKSAEKAMRAAGQMAPATRLAGIIGGKGTPEDTQAAFEQLSAAIGSANLKTEEGRDVYVASRIALNELSDAIGDRLAPDFESLTGEQQKSALALATTKAQIDDASAAFDKLDRESRKAGRGAGNFGSAINRLRSNIRTFGFVFGTFLGVNMVRQADAAFLEVRQRLNEGGDDWFAFRDRMLDVGADVGATWAETGSAAVMGLRRGIPDEELERFTEITTRFGTVARMLQADVGQASGFAGMMFRRLNVEVEDMDEVFNSFIVSGRRGMLMFGDLSNIISRNVEWFQVAGSTSLETSNRLMRFAGAAQVLSQYLGDSQSAAAATNEMMSRLTQLADPQVLRDYGGALLSLLANYGSEAANSFEEIVDLLQRRDYPALLHSVMTAAMQVPEDQIRQLGTAIENVIGLPHEIVRAMRVDPRMADRLAEMLALVDQNRDSTEALAQAEEQYRDTLEYSLRILRRTGEMVVIKVLRPIAQFLTDAVGVVSHFLQGLPPAAFTVLSAGAQIAAIVGLGAVIFKFAMALTPVGAAILGLTVALTAIAALVQSVFPSAARRRETQREAVEAQLRSAQSMSQLTATLTRGEEREIPTTEERLARVMTAELGAGRFPGLEAGFIALRDTLVQTGMDRDAAIAAAAERQQSAVAEAVRLAAGRLGPEAPTFRLMGERFAVAEEAIASLARQRELAEATGRLPATLDEVRRVLAENIEPQLVAVLARGQAAIAEDPESQLAQAFQQSGLQPELRRMIDQINETLQTNNVELLREYAAYTDDFIQGLERSGEQVSVMQRVVRALAAREGVAPPDRLTPWGRWFTIQSLRPATSGIERLLAPRMEDKFRSPRMVTPLGPGAAPQKTEAGGKVMITADSPQAVGLLREIRDLLAQKATMEKESASASHATPILRMALLRGKL